MLQQLRQPHRVRAESWENGPIVWCGNVSGRKSWFSWMSIYTGERRFWSNETQISWQLCGFVKVPHTQQTPQLSVIVWPVGVYVCFEILQLQTDRCDSTVANKIKTLSHDVIFNDDSICTINWMFVPHTVGYRAKDIFKLWETIKKQFQIGFI